jgi:hypothetical protein
MTPELWGQVTSIIGMILIISSFQFKNKVLFYAAQMSGNVFYAVSFLLLGNMAGALMNLLGIIRGVVMLQSKQQRKMWQFVALNVVFLAATVFSATVGGMGWAALLSFAAMTVGTVCMWFGNDRAIRWGQLFGVSPLWMLNNTVISFSLGGILGECFSMISTIIYLIRVSGRKSAAQNTKAEDAK